MTGLSAPAGPSVPAESPVPAGPSAPAESSVPDGPSGAHRPVVPGEVLCAEGPITLNAGRPLTTLRVVNTGDRPVQVGSHFHFAEANPALDFDRATARGQRLAVPAGTSVRFEPGAARDVELVPFAGLRVAAGFRGEVAGPLDDGGGGEPPTDGGRQVRDDGGRQVRDDG